MNFDLYKNLTWEYVLEHPNMKWNYFILSHNECVTMDIVNKYSDKPWDLNILIQNKNITWDIIKNNPQYEWNYYYFSYNPNMTWKIAIENPNIVWDYSRLTYLDDVDWNVIENNLNRGWDYYYLSESNKITTEIVLKYPNLPWSPKLLLKNKNISIDKEFIDSLNNRYNKLSGPGITYDECEY
jgi:hypothetical protein